MNPQLLLNLLKDGGYIDENQLTDLKEEQNRSGKTINQVVEDNGVLSQQDQLYLIAQQLGTEYVDLTDREFPPDLLSRIPPHAARTYGALPIAYLDGTLQMALTDPLDLQIVDNLASSSGL